MSIKQHGNLIAGSSVGSAEAKIWAEGTDEQVQALGGEKSAKGYAESISQDAQAAQTAKTDAENAKKLAQSYAVGDTDARPGEEEDNAKYYAEQAQAATAGKLDKAVPVVSSSESSLSVVPGNAYHWTVPASTQGVLSFDSTGLTGKAASIPVKIVLSEGASVTGDAVPSPVTASGDYVLEWDGETAVLKRDEKADKVLGEVEGQVPVLTADGNLASSGIPADKVAKQDGYYKDMTVGEAENLIDPNATPEPAEFGFRTAAGEVSIMDGKGAVHTQLGSTEIANQIVAPIAVDIKVSTNGKAIVDAIGGDVKNLTMRGSVVIYNQLVKDSINKTTSGTGRLGCSDGVAGNAESFVFTAPRSVVLNQWIDTGDTEVTLTNGRTWLTYIGGVSSKVSGTGQSVSCTGGTDMAVDLTQYFNNNSTLINSITSWDDLVAYDPTFANYIAYNTGTVKGVTPTAKVNHTTDVTCPVELFAVGSAADEYEAVAGVTTRKMGSYTFTGNETWQAYNVTFYCNIPGKKNGFTNVLMADYVTRQNISQVISNDMSLSGLDTQSLVYVHDASYTSASACAAGMAGKTIYYELATPTTTSYTPATIPTVNIYNNAVQTSNERKATFSMTYQGREQTLQLNPNHTYAFLDNGITDSIITGQSSIDVVGMEDMLVDITQLYCGDESKIADIRRWASLSTRFHCYRELQPYNPGTIVPAPAIVQSIPGEYAYGAIYNPNVNSVTCQRVQLNNGVLSEVSSFSEFERTPCHQLWRCVMPDLANRVVAYYLDDEDSDKKFNGTRNGITSDGSASVLTGGDGDVETEIPEGYWYMDEDYNGEGKVLWLVSDKPFAGTHSMAEIHDFFFVSPNGSVHRKQYVGAFRACLCDANGTPLNTTEGALSQATGTSSTNKVRSIAGALPYVNVNQNDLLTRSKRNGGSTVNARFHSWLLLLMIIEQGSTNTQAISAGYSNGIQNAFCFWRKSGRCNFGNGTGQLYADETSQDMDNFQSFKIGSTTVQRDTLKDEEGRYAWSIYNRNASSTRYYTDTPTPSNGDPVYTAPSGETTAGSVSSYTLKTGRVIQFQYRGIENPFGEVWEFEHGLQKYSHAYTASIKANNVVYNRDPFNNGVDSLAWTTTGGITVWTPYTLTNAHAYSDPELTQDTGYAVSVNSYRYDILGYWETLATNDYTSTEQQTSANPTYSWHRHRWPMASGYIKKFDPATFFILTTGGSASTYIPDYYYDNAGSGSRVSLVGGYAYYGAAVGMGIRFVSGALASSYVYIGGRASA